MTSPDGTPTPAPPGHQPLPAEPGEPALPARLGEPSRAARPGAAPLSAQPGDQVPAARLGETSGGVRRGWPDRVVLGVLGVLSAAGYLAVSVQQFVTFRAGSFDLVIFDQAVRSYSRGHSPVSLLKDVHTGFPVTVSVLGDHISPILVLLAPLYWLHDGPVTLLVAQASLLAATVWPLWTLGRREAGRWVGYGLAVAYALSFPVAQAVSFDFHEVAFAPLLMAVLLDRLSAYRHRVARVWQPALAGVALALVKEDMGLVLAGLGVALLVLAAPRAADQRRARVWLGAGLLTGGLAVTALGTRVLIPAFGGSTEFDWRYDRLGATPGQVLRHMLTDPADTLSVLTHPAVKWHTMLLLLALSGLAALASPYLLMVLPLLLARLLSGAPNWWGTDFHYNAFLVVPLLYAGLDGALRIQRWVARRRPVPVVPAWAVLVVVVAVLSVPSFALGNLARPAAWRGGPDQAAARAAVAAVPRGALVEAASNLGPRLSGRARVVLWDRLPRDAPWVVADERRYQFPFCDLAEQRDRVAHLEISGYQVVLRRGGYVVLRWTGPPRPLASGRAPACG